MPVGMGGRSDGVGIGVASTVTVTCGVSGSLRGIQLAYVAGR